MLFAGDGLRWGESCLVFLWGLLLGGGGVFLLPARFLPITMIDVSFE